MSAMRRMDGGYIGGGPTSSGTLSLPGPVDARESPQGVVIFEESPPHQIVEVSEAPGNQPGSRDVEEDIEGPRVDVDPAELSAEHDGDTLPA